MMAVLTDKVAIVTGAGSGIGAASAARLADAGASVVVVDRDEASAHQVADRLGALAVVADVSRSDQWGSITEAARLPGSRGESSLAHLSTPRVSTGEPDVSLLTDEQYRRARRGRRRQHGVRIQHWCPPPTAWWRPGGHRVVGRAHRLLARSIYGLTKSRVVGLVRALAPQLAEQDIILNAICPSLVDAPCSKRPCETRLKGSGFPLIEPDPVARRISMLTGAETGQGHGHPEPIGNRWPTGSPNPGASGRGGGGKLPPAALAAHDQE